MRSHSAIRTALLATCAAILPAGAALGQTSAPDSLRLGALHEAAIRSDPRWSQLELLQSQLDLRLRSLASEQLPALSLQSQGQLQSDVPSIPFDLPGGATPPVPPRDSYDAHIALRQAIYDPSLGPRRGLERARLGESRAGVRSALYTLRRSVDEAFFTVLRLQTQAAMVEVALADLEAQWDVVSSRVREGAALESESATLQREILRRRQSLDEMQSSERAARHLLAELAGHTVSEEQPLALPDLEAAVTAAGASELRQRPEFERFAYGRAALERQQEAVAARVRPRISAFGRSGYGRPGLNPLASTFDSYWLGGVQLEWSPWKWGTTANERQELALQREILDSEEAAFAAEIRRGTIAELASIERLQRALDRDQEIIELSERILAESRLRFSEGVITSAELVDDETDVLEARLSRAAHHIELAHARARFLTLIGYDMP